LLTLTHTTQIIPFCVCSFKCKWAAA